MRYIVVFLILFGLAGCSVSGGHPVSSPADEQAGVAAAEDVGTLTFLPDYPKSGERVDVVYQPIKVFAGQSRLQLRARLRTAQDDGYNHGMGAATVALLEHQGDGTYRGSFVLPADAVYAAFAVEDAAGADVDSRAGRFWDLLVHDDDGRALFEALEQRFNDYMGRDQLEVLQSAQAMVRLYPDHPGAWGMLRAAEGWVLGEQGAEERLARHRGQLRELDRALAQQQDLDADLIGHMYWNARGLREQELTARWRQRLLDEHPGHFLAVQDRMMALHGEHREDPTVLLGELEALWQLANDSRGRKGVGRLGFATSRQIGDAEAIIKWAGRSVELSPSDRGHIARLLSQSDTTRKEGIRWLRAELSRIDSEGHSSRPLGASVQEHRQSMARRAADLRTSLGDAMMATGRIPEAIAALESATLVGWNSQRFQSLGEAQLASGNHKAAIDAFAAVAADPATAPEVVDRLRGKLEASADIWEQAIALAREEMIQRTLQSARAVALPAADIVLPDGSPGRLEDLVSDEPMVIAFWSRDCAPSVRAMPQIAELSQQLASDGVRLLAVTRNSISRAQPYLEEGGWDIQVIFDTEGEAARALSSWGTPQYFVVDAAGRVRFALSSIEALPRQVAALQSEPARSH